MDISQYYQQAKEIGELPELKKYGSAESILSALDYDRLDDHPSMWVPNVQTALLECITSNPNSSFSEQVIELYTQGAIMENHAERNIVVKAGVVCLAIGVFLGWLLWA